MIPVYLNTADYAKEKGELDQYRDSKRKNRECKKAIEEAISKNFDGFYLAKNCEEPVIAEYGLDRVKTVLANTVRIKNSDGRFGRDVKTWAANFILAEEDVYSAVESHPAVLDGFIRRVMNASTTLNEHGGIIPKVNIRRAEQVLIDNGIEKDEAGTVLQAIGYTLLDTELYPEEDRSKEDK